MIRTRALALSIVLAACASDGGDASGTGASTGSSMDGSTGGSDPATTGSSDAADTTGAGGRYHPAGFETAQMHGPPMKLHEQDCRACHGEDLTGGTSAVSCDSCHTPDWRTDCTFCHGGTAEPSGAPPRDLDGSTDVAGLSFQAHTKHATFNVHPAYGCEQCHSKPVDVLSPGHVFDDTDARAEVDFTAGLSPSGAWDGSAACSELYCHGDGNGTLGAATHDMPTPSCGGCHPYPGSENLDYTGMSGQHRRHVNEGIACSECHDPNAAMTHVDGAKDVQITAAGFMFDAAQKRCTGACHLKLHGSEHW